jgi:hypothetical protein
VQNQPCKSSTASPPQQVSIAHQQYSSTASPQQQYSQLTSTGLHCSSSTVNIWPATEGRWIRCRQPLWMRARTLLPLDTASTSHTPALPASPRGTECWVLTSQTRAQPTHTLAQHMWRHAPACTQQLTAQPAAPQSFPHWGDALLCLFLDTG